MYDFANILFSGPCSAHCYFCIGQQVSPERNQPNLDLFPPAGLDQLIARVWQEQIRQVVFTGTNTDPQLYRHEERLLGLLRRELPSTVRFSLHTNGRQALRKMDVFNQYDRATLSLPSFQPEVYYQMMGVRNPPNLAEIMPRVRIPLKVSCLVDEHNGPGLFDFLQTCQQMGVRRVVLRKLFGDFSTGAAWLDAILPAMQPGEAYRGNPVYLFAGMEVTFWDFAASQSRSINLFANGALSEHYLLTEAG